MAYDKNLDKQLFSTDKDFESTKINVAVFSYNDGEAKIQIGRENRDMDGNWRWSKLGRITKEEAEAVHDMLSKAIKAIDAK